MITKDMTIGELVQLYPSVVEILIEEGVRCVGCGAAHFETIEEGLSSHGKTEEEIDFADMLARRLLQSKLSREPRTLSIQGEELQGVLFKTDSGPIIVTGNFIAKVTADGKLGRLLPRTPGSTSAKK